MITTNYIEITDEHQPGRKLYYYESGHDNKDVVICAHALTRNGRDFDFLSQELASHFRVIAVDFPGRGNSTFLTDSTRYDYSLYYHDILQLYNKLGIKKAKWVGSSMGGLVGLTVLALSANLIEKIVLNDVGPHIPIAALQRISKYVGVTPVFNTINDVENHLRLIFKPFAITNDDHWRHMANHSYRPYENNKLTLNIDFKIADNFSKFMHLTEDIELWEGWNSFSVPTLVLRGKESDILTSATYQKMLEKQGVSGIEFDGIGHLPALMDISQITIVKNWLLSDR